MRILIAEDDGVSRSILSALLKKDGHDVVETTDGVAAWEEFSEPDAPKLAVLDWMMPQLNGLDLIHRIRSLPTEEPPHLIMVTVRDEKADIVTALEAGADDYVSKPFDAGELRARINVGIRIVEARAALVQSRKTLVRQASYDSLTDLLNRGAILARFQEELDRAGREGSAVDIGIIDIDHFKSVNDRFGHPAGDDVLRGIARRFVDALRSYDSVGRLGGEEFLVLAPRTRDRIGATDQHCLFERIRALVAQEGMMTRCGSIKITVSIGCASAVTESIDEAIALADEALYRAKANGRDRVEYADGSHPC